jgi:hypothetical protein
VHEPLKERVDPLLMEESCHTGNDLSVALAGGIA